MKKLIAFLLTATMVLTSANISFAVTADDEVIVTKPTITQGIDGETLTKPQAGFNSAAVYVLNRGNAKNMLLSAVSGDNVIASAQTEVGKGESVRLNIGFTLATDTDNVTLQVKNADTNEVYSDFVSVDASKDFMISYTNAENNFVIDNDIIFEFNSIVSDIGKIEVIQNGKVVTTTQEVTVVNGKTTLTIKPAEVWTAKNFIRLTLPDITDIFGRVIKSEEFAFSTANIGDIYEVYQTASVINQAGIGGFAVLADFDGGKPQKVYFSRKTSVPNDTHDYQLPQIASAVAMVIDPAGKLAAIYDFSDMPSGKKNVVIELPYACEGIWQFKFVSARNGDLLEIGLPNAKNWGVRGESELGVTDTTPKESYIYVPEKVNNLYVGTSGMTASVYDTDGTLKMSTSEAKKTYAKSDGLIENIEGETVYKLTLPSSEGGMFIDYAPSLMCPTEDMARNLKGGWIDVDGVLVQGSLQKAAREYLIDYVKNNDFEIKFTKPASYSNLQYPEANALLFGPSGVISGVKKQAEKQNFDNTSPYFGSFVSDTTDSWEDGAFHGATSVLGFSELINMDAELNAFYHNDALVKRMAASILASVVALSEEGMIKDNATSADAPLTHGNFYLSYTTRAYMNIRNFLDTETRNFLDNAMIQLVIKQGDMPGRGPTNQWLFTVTGLTSIAYATDDEIVKGMLDRHLTAYTGEPSSTKGQSSAGYFIEGSGCDGDYHNLSRDLTFEIYETLQRRDPQNTHLAKLHDMILENTEFTSMFMLPQKNGNFMSNATTSRTAGSTGAASHITYTKIMDEFPLAKRRFEMSGVNEKWAYDMLLKYFSQYDSGASNSSSGNVYEFEAYKNVKDTTMESEPMPYEYESGIWERDGIIAVKHNGLYLNVFYTTPESTSLPSLAYMGGGMTLLYGDGVETTVASRKNNDTITSYDDVRASCVFGKKTDGGVFVTGKEKATFEWLEKDKKFKISGTTPQGIGITWTYTLTDSGIKQEVEVTGDTSELWLNVPISNVCDRATLDRKDNGVVYSVDGNSIAFDWDSTEEYNIKEFTETTINGKSVGEKLQCVRIKMPSTGKLTMNMSYSQKPIHIKGAAVAENGESVDVTVRNNTKTPQELYMIYATYSEDGSLKYVNISDKLTVGENTDKTHKFTVEALGSGERASIFAWESPDNVKPLDTYQVSTE